MADTVSTPAGVDRLLTLQAYARPHPLHRSRLPPTSRARRFAGFDVAQSITIDCDPARRGSCRLIRVLQNAFTHERRT